MRDGKHVVVGVHHHHRATHVLHADTRFPRENGIERIDDGHHAQVQLLSGRRMPNGTDACRIEDHAIRLQWAEADFRLVLRIHRRGSGNLRDDFDVHDGTIVRRPRRLQGAEMAAKPTGHLGENATFRFATAHVQDDRHLVPAADVINKLRGAPGFLVIHAEDQVTFSQVGGTRRAILFHAGDGNPHRVEGNRCTFTPARSTVSSGHGPSGWSLA